MLGLGGNIFNLGVCVAAGCGAVLFFVFVSFVGGCCIFFVLCCRDIFFEVWGMEIIFFRLDGCGEMDFVINSSIFVVRLQGC